MNDPHRLVLRAHLVGFIALAGCAATVPPPSGSAVASDAPPFVSRVAPRPAHPLEVTFGTSLRLLGYDLEAPEPLHPGDRLRITWYWHCLAPVGVGWEIFTHLDADDRPVFSANRLGEVRARWQPPRWRAGDFIRDEQTIEVPSEWTGELLRVYVGFERGGERMRVAPGAVEVVTGRARAIELPVRPR
jgi:hypothetical protein